MEPPQKEPISGEIIVRIPAAAAPLAIAQDATSPLVKMWLHGLSANTQRAYRKDLALFFATVGRDLGGLTLDDVRAVSIDQVQAYDQAMIDRGLADNTRLRRLAGVKSFFSYIDGIQRLDPNPLAAIRLPHATDALTERILPVAQVMQLIAAAGAARDRVMLSLLYFGGFRVSEVAAMRWAAARPHRQSGQLTVVGKGRKKRTVLLPPQVWSELLALRQGASEESPIFTAAGGGGGELSACQMRRLIKTAARAAGIDSHISPHWLRHCHASHALDAGAKLTTVRDTLGHASISTTDKYLHARPDQSSAQFLSNLPTDACTPATPHS
jgi:integrase/recombinase XerD